VDIQFVKRFSRGLLVGTLSVLLLHVGTGLLHAQLITLKDGDSVVKIDPTAQNPVSDWAIGATNYLNRQGFWYLLGGSGPAKPLNTLTLVSETLSDTNADGLWDMVGLGYALGGLKVDVKYSLTGGDPGSGSSNLGEQVKLVNSGGSPLNVRLFQYTDADLSASGDLVEFLAPSHVLQVASNGFLDSANTGPASLLTHFEAGLTTDSPTNTLQRLQTVNNLSLNDASGPLSGNATYAYQWDTTLQPGRSITLGQNNSLNVTPGSIPTPEPGSLGLMAAAAIGLGLIVVRRRRASR
jgi:hypothetical protein